MPCARTLPINQKQPLIFIHQHIDRPEIVVNEGMIAVDFREKVLLWEHPNYMPLILFIENSAAAFRKTQQTLVRYSLC